VALGGTVSMTLQNGYAVTQSLGSSPTAPQFDPNAIPPPKPLQSGTSVLPPAQVWSNDDALRLSLGSTGTTFSVGAKMQSTDERWLRTLSAEQKLFGGPVSVTGAVTELPTGDTSKSIMAGFKRAW